VHLKAVIFDLDGVIVSTDEFHYQGWKHLADEEGIYFDRNINERLRGVSRMESLDILLERAEKQYHADEKIQLAARKNEYYRQLLSTLSPADILPGVIYFLDELKRAGIKIAVGSSSKNSPAILKRIGMSSLFDATADGNEIKKSKPDPEVFLLAAKKLGVAPANCLVVEDAVAGVEAAIAGGMKVLAVGSAAGDDRAQIRANDLASITAAEVLAFTASN
jgi:beta-phosphoglucomutase